MGKGNTCWHSMVYYRVPILYGLDMEAGGRLFHEQLYFSAVCILFRPEMALG